MTVYVFDMDGTLTPPGLPILPEYTERFLNWQNTHLNFLATGSDFSKVEKQFPRSVINAFSGIYSSMGNVFSVKEKTVYQNKFKENKKLDSLLENYRAQTKYPGELFQNYIEKRPGMINFSVLGRNCPQSAREQYSAWDKNQQEREKIAAELRSIFPEYDIAVGGMISIDITPRGLGKEQIALRLRENYPHEKIIFFGDKTMVGGNDYALAHALLQLENTQVVQVDGMSDVLEFLKNT